MRAAVDKHGGTQRDFAIANDMPEKDVSRHLKAKVPRGMPFNKAMQLAQKYQIDLNGMLTNKEK